MKAPMFEMLSRGLSDYKDKDPNGLVLFLHSFLNTIVARIEELEKKLDKFLAAFGIERVCVWEELDALKIQMDELRSKLEHPNGLDLSINGSDQKGGK